VQIEIRDRRPPVYRKQETTPQPPKEIPKPKEPSREQEVKPPIKEILKVPMPVKGVPIKSQRGYFIKTSCDEFFRAIEKGKVLYAGDDLKSYSWVVMVEQEDGYITVYTMAERLFVKKGESVKKGQVLGKVGKQGQDCGIGFELRLKDGSPINFELVKE
jgi:septal ring factor EnvC (AmiA/AmiB activator)